MREMSLQIFKRERRRSDTFFFISEEGGKDGK